MIRALPERDRVAERRAAWLQGRKWHRRFVPLGIVRLEGRGRAIVVCRVLDTRWSDKHARRLWRVPA